MSIILSLDQMKVG